MIYISLALWVPSHHACRGNHSDAQEMDTLKISLLLNFSVKTEFFFQFIMDFYVVYQSLQ